jgi:putative ABC transport system permease protein
VRRRRHREAAERVGAGDPRANDSAPGPRPERSRLRPADVLRVGSVGLRTRRQRAALSAVGIAIGIASMVAVLGISESSNAGLNATLDRLGTNLLTAEATAGLAGGAPVLPDTAVPMLSDIAPVEQVATTTPVEANVYVNDMVPEELSNGITVEAADPSLLDALSGTMAEGAFLDRASERYQAAVVGSVAAQRLGVDRIGQRIWIDGHWFTVVGIMDSVELAEDLDRTVLVGHPIAERLYDADEAPGTVYLRADPDDITDVQSVVPATADPSSPDEVAVSRPSEALEAKAAANDTFTTLFLGLGAVALLVGGVGIANVMVIAVIERRGEIGLRRALGATQGHVRTQFLVEAVLLAVLGGLVGVGLGAVATTVYAVSQDWAITIPLSAVGGGFAAALVVGAIAGLYPAGRAARLSPTEALRST